MVAYGRAGAALTQQPDAAEHWVFSQYLSSLLQLSNAIMRAVVPAAAIFMQQLDGSSPLARLLLPAAELALHTLLFYTGNRAAAIFTADSGRAEGYELVFTCRHGVKSEQGEHQLLFTCLIDCCAPHAGLHWGMRCVTTVESWRAAAAVHPPGL